MKLYTLRITSDHAKAVIAALDLFDRISMGQTKEIGSVFEGKNGDWQQQRDAGLDRVLEQLKSILFPDLTTGGYYGIMSPATGKTAHLCHEVHNCLRHRVAWSEYPKANGEMPTTHHDTPILFPSEIEPIPECSVEDGKQPEIEYNGYRLHRAMYEIVGTHDVAESLRIIRGWKDLVENHVSKTVPKE